MAEININEVKEKVMNTIGNMADKTRDFAEKTADKAKGMARIAKLTMEISGEKDMIKKAYIEIGKLYYETHKDDPDGFFVQLCDEITLAMESITAKQDEIDQLKSDVSETADESIEVEFESVVAEAEEAAEAPEEEDAEEDAE